MHHEKRKYEIKMMIFMNEMNYLCDKINETRREKKFADLWPLVDQILN